MANVIRENVEFGKSSLVIYDTSCAYDPITNLGGYGAPNEEIGNAISAVVEITPPGETVPIIVTDIFPTLPNDTGTGYEIFLDDLNLTEIVVGEWNFKYTVTFVGDISFESECKFLNTCPVEACLNGKAMQLDPTCLNNSDAEIIKLNQLFNAATKNHCLGNYDKANELINYVNTKCNCCC